MTARRPTEGRPKGRPCRIDGRGPPPYPAGVTDRALVDDKAPDLADRLEGLAFALAALVPLGMALLNRSALPLMVAAALAALAAAGLRGATAQVLAVAAAALRSPLGTICCLFLALALVSVLQSHHAARSLSAYGEFLLACAAAGLLHAALPRRIPGWVPKFAAIATAIGCLTIVAELATGMSGRIALGLRADTFIFKRSVTAILIVAWPVAFVLWQRGKAPIGVAILILVGLASLAAHSSGALLGLAAGAAFAGVAAASRRVAGALLGVGLMTATAIAPVLGDAADKLLPPRLVERLAFAHARERIDIWQSFGEVAQRRIALGAGFGTSPVMAREPVAAEVPPERRLMLGAWHPHNAYLQVWAELGLAGAVLAAAALLLVCRNLARAPRWTGVAGAALAGSAATILTVGHGAWQGWWAAVVGAALIWILRLEPPRSRP